MTRWLKRYEPITKIILKIMNAVCPNIARTKQSSKDGSAYWQLFCLYSARTKSWILLVQTLKIQLTKDNLACWGFFIHFFEGWRVVTIKSHSILLPIDFHGSKNLTVKQNFFHRVHCNRIWLSNTVVKLQKKNSWRIGPRTK